MSDPEAAEAAKQIAPFLDWIPYWLRGVIALGTAGIFGIVVKILNAEALRKRSEMINADVIKMLRDQLKDATDRLERYQADKEATQQKAQERLDMMDTQSLKRGYRNDKATSRNTDVQVEVPQVPHPTVDHRPSNRKKDQ